MEINQDDTDNAVPKQKTHLFQPGQSGNPKGKPKGTKNHATRLAEKLFDGETEKLTRKAIELALEGDMTALRLCLERILPPRKSRPVNITLPEVKTAEGVAEAQAAVVQAVADGELTPEEATALTGILEARRKTIETQDHESRISALESKKGQK